MIQKDPKFAIRLIVDIAIRELDVGFVYDDHGVLRVNYPTPDWNDFLSLAIEEIRYYGAGSYQVMRRLRALLNDLVQYVPLERIQAVEYQQKRVATVIAQSFQDPEDQSFVQEADRQGISIVK